jgi:hypothetical protein
MTPRVAGRYERPPGFHIYLHRCSAWCGRRVAVADSRCVYCAAEGKESKTPLSFLMYSWDIAKHGWDYDTAKPSEWWEGKE